MNSRVPRLVALTPWFLLPALSMAGPGSLEINQACVADGCFPGDAGGFPVTVAASGSYSLTSNLLVPDENTHAIVVDAASVSIELNGFTIEGPVRCTGLEDDCTPGGGSGVGILATSGSTNVSVSNGSIVGMGWKGLQLVGQSSIERMRVEHARRAAASLGVGGRVSQSAANRNGYLGWEATDARLIDVTATGNGQAGINCARCIVERATVHDNVGVGMFDGYGSIVTNSVFARNGIGVWSTNGGTRLLANQFVYNNGLGFFAQPAVPPDIPDSETQVSTLSGNSFIENNGGNHADQIGGSGGLWVELDANLCGLSTTCP
ncbi:MAG: hypothetical protein KDJ14_07545 [Xanthomonadales bacterium]|nr:hypothetical protein [Xanthomonadales bacterium]